MDDLSVGRALVLDDDQEVRALVADFLRTGCWVETTPRTGLGLKLARILHPDLVLLDVSPPQPVPEALAIWLRIQFGPGLPIVAVGLDHQTDLARRMGVSAFLLMSFGKSQLVRRVRHAMALIDRSRDMRRRSEQAREELLELLGTPTPCCGSALARL